MTDRTELRAAKTHLTHLLQRNSEVNGIGLGRVGTRWVLRVNLRSDGPDARRGIPLEVDGVPVDVHVVGSVKATARR
jgi:hypothetical protein